MSSLAKVRQGAVNINAEYDIRGAQDAVLESRLGSPLFPGASETKNQGVYAHEIAYVETATQFDDVPRARTTLNGIAAEQQREGVGAPDWVSMCIENRINVLGAVLTTLTFPECTLHPAMPLQGGGLTLLPTLDAADVPRITPGDKLEAVVPVPGYARRAMPGHTLPAADSRQILRVRPVASRSTAHRLVVMLQQSANDPATFIRMMGPGLRNTDAWLSACALFHSFTLVNALTSLTEFVDAGLVSAAPSRAALDAFEVRTNPAAAPGSNLATDGQRLAAFLATRMSVVEARDGNGTELPGPATADELWAYQELRARLIRGAVAAPGDTDNAWGFWNARAGRLPLDNGRESEDPRVASGLTTENGRLRKDPYGAFREAQLNSLERFATAVYHAQHDADRRVIGIAAAGESTDGFVSAIWSR